MIVTIKADITWEGQSAEVINGKSIKKIKAFLKDLTGAVDVDIIEQNAWDENDEDWKE